MAGFEPVITIALGVVFGVLGAKGAVDPGFYPNARGLWLLERVAGERATNAVKRFGGVVMALLSTAMVVGTVVELLP